MGAVTDPTADTRTVVRSFLGNMRRNPRDRAEMATLWDRLVTMPGDVAQARTVADEMEFAQGFATFHVRKLREGEAYPTGAEMLAVCEAEDAAYRERQRNKPKDTRKPWEKSKYHPGAPTLPGNRSPSA